MTDEEANVAKVSLAPGARDARLLRTANSSMLSPP